MFGVVCVTTAGVRLVKAASFQQTAGQVLERQLVTPAPAMAGRDGEPPPAVEDGLVGRLEIPRLGVSVIVMKGEDEGTLARAVGHLGGTAFPWESGNVGLAGHRDTFFRPLRHIREGDAIRITTAHGTFDYRVASTEIVDPSNVSVLAPTSHRSLTLVTCYPFFYVGPAPKRFIVHAR